MADLLIKGMEMPSCCDECYALDEYGDYPFCRMTQEQRGYTFNTRERRMDKCPLVEVPAHGRLIDADLLYDKWIWGSTDRAAEAKCIELIDLSLAPTVLEASEVPTVIEAEDSND